MDLAAARPRRVAGLAGGGSAMTVTAMTSRFASTPLRLGTKS